MRYPNIRTLRAELVAERAYLRRSFSSSDLTDAPDEVPGTPVRLQVTRGGWQLHSGDPSFDLDHRGVWGSGFLALGSGNLTDLARELIDDAKNSAAS